ncbi:MAG: tetratricopeptide repeat protein [Bacteroidales bacterium]
MKLPDLFKITKGTRVVISITLGICGTAILVAVLYYRGLNRSEDPRLVPVRELIQKSEELTGNRKAPEAFLLLDSALHLLKSVPGYENSYETGVIFNNACSAWLLSALYDSTLVSGEKEKMLVTAHTFADSSLRIYRAWISEWDSLPGDQIRIKIAPFFKPDDPAFAGRNPHRILDKRVKDIQSAQIETPRRLSVNLTNLGTIHRHMNRPDSALVCYAEALHLWKENKTAESNLNVLKGGKPLKPSILKSLFPPDKKK